MKSKTVDDALDKSSGAWTYSETVARGLYERNRRGLFGKHDNVRAYWEDELTRSALRPFVRAQRASCAAAGRGLRVLDSGAAPARAMTCSLKSVETT